MNLTKLFEAQKELDDRIAAEHPLETGEDRLAKKILALQVELGECANEWRGFKFWSKDQSPRIVKAITSNLGFGEVVDTGLKRNPLLEEYVDCLHFILSIGLEIGVTNLNGENLNEELKDTTEAFQHAFNWCASLDFARAKGIWNGKGKAYERLFDVFLALGYHLGFTWEQIEHAYWAKHQINHNRQATGY